MGIKWQRAKWIGIIGLLCLVAGAIVQAGHAAGRYTAQRESEKRAPLEQTENGLSTFNKPLYESPEWQSLQEEVKKTAETAHAFDEMFRAQAPENNALIFEATPDLTPSEGEFLAVNDDWEVVASADGKLYGYEEDYWIGCSVWCAVGDYEVSATASSVLPAQGQFSYEAEHIISQNRDDAWVEGADDYGIGEYVTIEKRYDRMDGTEGDCFFFTDLCIVNGMAKDEASWEKNSRVKTLKMYFNDEYVCDLELLDTFKPQYISLKGLRLSAGNNENSVFKFEIADVYKGDMYSDTAITGIEVRFYTNNH